MAVVVGAAMGAVPVAPIGGGNALTLPAQRHLVRVPHPDGTASLLLALQQDRAGGHGLGFHRSDDEGQSWYWAAAIQDDSTHRDTADVIQLGQDLALVYSYEGPTLAGNLRHDVYFQRWRYLPASKAFAPDPPVLVFDSTSSSTGYYRAEIATDSLGRLWVQAFLLRADGWHDAAIAVSQDDGQSFSAQPDLVTLSSRGGGRLLSLGDRLLFLFDQHNDLGPARFMVRLDSAPLGAWGPIQTAFTEGIYHGAALSAVATDSGQMHLVYKGELDERLWYRPFDGMAFGPRQPVDDTNQWASMPGVTLIGDDLYIFYNRLITPNVNYEIRARRVRGGVVSAPAIVDTSVSFKGYPAAVDRLPSTVSLVPCVFGFTPDASSSGEAKVVFVQNGNGEPPPGDGGSPDAGAPDAGTPDAGVPDAGVPDAGMPDAGTPRPDGGTLWLTPVLTNTTHEFLGVGTTGTAYALRLGESPRNLYASTDQARTWSRRTTHTSSFYRMATLESGVLVAEVSRDGRRFLSRSADDGQTWQNVLELGQYRMLTPHSIAELDGEVFFAEYQAFTSQSVPIRLWVSADQARTWTVRHIFQGHRHAHGIRADPARAALWVLFGDTNAQSGVYRSTDDGYTWIKMLGNQQGDVVDAIVTPDGLLFGQDISSLPDLPHIATLSFDGVYRELTRITGPAYSSYPIREGGFLVGAAREPHSNIYPPGEVSAHLYGSADGVQWADLMQLRRISSNENTRADVYWELPSGEVVLQVENVEGFGPGGKGYQLLLPSIR